jgi:hypothetical protein
MGSLRSSNNEKYGIRVLSPKTRHHEVENPRIRNLRKGAQGAPITWCRNCKKKGHSREHCWFLHPNLRPKQTRRGGDSQEEKMDTEKGGEQESRITHLATVPNSTIEDNKFNFSRSSSAQDLMWQVYQLLCVLLQQNMNKPSLST